MYRGRPRVSCPCAGEEAALDGKSELPGLPPVHVTRVEITVRTSDVVAASYVRENGMGLI